MRSSLGPLLLLLGCGASPPAARLLALGPGPSATPLDPLAAPSGRGAGATAFTLPNRIAGHLVSNRVPQVAVDARGGVHAVYAASAVDAEGHRSAFYVYCPGRCDAAARFDGVRLADGLGDAQLALDPAGHPRVLLTVGPDAQNTVEHQLWACDADCNQPGRWRGLVVARVKGAFFVSGNESRRSFAVDAKGRMSLVFSANPFGGEVGGTLLASCDAGCLDAKHWTTTALWEREVKNLSLALAPDGTPRVLFIAQRPEPDYEPFLFYMQCERRDCGGAQPVPLLMTATAGADSEAGFALRLDAAGRPRAALYPGSGSGGTLKPNRLYYLLCDAGCTTLDGWNALDIGVEERGGEGGVDLAIDAAGRTRLAYRVPAPTDELALAWCDEGCASGSVKWRHVLLPATREVAAELGLPPRMGCPDCVPPIPPCPAAFWDAGWWPAVTLDGAGVTRVVYEAQLQVGGGQCTAGTLGRVSRLAVVPQ